MPGWVNCRECGKLTERFTEEVCETCIGRSLLGSALPDQSGEVVNATNEAASPS